MLPWSGSRFPPVRVGPTWQTTADGHWLLPDATIGWDALAWCGANLQHGVGQPWRFTDEQARFMLWWYAVDDRGRWLYDDGVLQRLKGWGKDPVVGCLSYVEMLGPCRVAYMDGDDPIATDMPGAWVQLPAVSLEQTKNTTRLMPGLISPAAEVHYGVAVGKQTVYAMGDDRLIQAVTSSPTTLEGARATAVFPNETQHWLANNEGHEMAAVIERNATKSAGGTSRRLAVTNAYEPSEDSVAQHDREAWELGQSGESMGSSTLYDSLEAPPEAPLSLPIEPGESEEDHEVRVRSVVSEVVRNVRGDSVWLDPERIVRSVLDVRNPPSRSRRFWYNQIEAAEDAWLDPKHVAAAAAGEFDGLDLQVTDELVLFFDGSKSDDATGLVGARMSDGHVVTFGVWERPAGAAGKAWRVNRGEVDRRVRDVLAQHNVVAFWADPSHAKDDDSTGWWDETIDAWHRDFSDRLRCWAVASGPNRHSIMWDMASPERTKQFTLGAERFVAEIEDAALCVLEGRREARQLTYDGHPAMVRHLRNARRHPNRYGVSLAKEHRESSRKIDLAVCAVGARLLRRQVLNAAPADKPRSGVVRGIR
ncbi:MAG: terminase [Acidimicrobiia bacterium]|nr:MAG: terminase [Acidimicrobiia bacterium]